MEASGRGRRSSSREMTTDVMDRFTVLRGKGMPSLYSWSCKRSYKNGYVWNDLGENDVIYPSDGAEYVLKGSELIQPCTEKFQQLRVSNLSQEVPDPTFHQKRKPVATKRQCDQPEADVNSRSEEEEEEGDDDDNQDGDEEGEYEDKKTCSMSMTPPQHASRCSRGVSTDETELTHKNNINTSTELTLDDSSPPSTTSSTVSDKAHDNNNASTRFEDGNVRCIIFVYSEIFRSKNKILSCIIFGARYLNHRPQKYLFDYFIPELCSLVP
ncbi:hypothetical protein RHMOL_Rhmol08G0011600 [Rhododendron molle]|uniref:Uncharacterized protein n=1 Tax=Rhododendron molle TaxID=49168 RepID=A0ACC0MIQ9_RHOML|nr:hypothetical protein RHMOL_Rhmol08G0011600 [Rhododendron molle]